MTHKEPTPEELNIIEEVVNILAPSFKFAYYDTDDLKQEGRMFALSRLPKYDPERASLKTFLIRVVRNDFLNLRRKKFYRYEPPCTACPFYEKSKKSEGDPSCLAFEKRGDCDKWVGWGKRNEAKKSLAGTVTFETAHDISYGRNRGDLTPPLDKIENNELFNIVDFHLPLELRGDFRRLVEGARLPKYRKLKLLEVIKEIIEEEAPEYE